MKILFSFIAVILLLISCQNSTNASNANPEKAQVQTPSLISKHPVMTWMRKSPVEIGCMFETELAFKDSVFNCSYKNYVNKGDPCKNSDAYYEGPRFPNTLANKIHPSIKEVTLNFEQGSLQELDITFNDSMLISDIKNIFKLSDTLPENVMSINYGENVDSKDKPVNPKYTRWLSLIGFEHMGAGDVDCE